MAPDPKNIDQTPEARTPTSDTDFQYPAISAHTIMRCVDARLRFPDAEIRELAAMTGINRNTVGRALTTPMALARIDSAYNIKPLVQERLRVQALNAFDLLTKVQERAMEMLENGADIDPSLLSAATKTSLETLKGVGILKDHVIDERKPVDVQELTELVTKVDKLRGQIQEQVDAEDQKKVEIQADAWYEDSSNGEEKVGETP